MQTNNQPQSMTPHDPASSLSPSAGLRALSSPTSVSDLLTLASNPSAFMQHPAYDKLFLQARAIHFESDSVALVLEGKAGLVRLNDKVTANPDAPTVVDLRGQRPSVSGLSVSDSFSIRADAGQGILVSAGVFLWVIDAEGNRDLLTLTRTQDAEIAPGEIQGPSGRCDRPVGQACFVELAEEAVILAQRSGQPVLLGVRGVPYLSDEDTVAIILGAKERAAQHLRSQLNERAEQLGPEVDALRNSLNQLLAANEVLLVDADAGPKGVERIETVMDGKRLESIDGMFSRYEYETNTLEARKVLVLDLRAHPGLEIMALFDGDGFGRSVRLADPTAAWTDPKCTLALRRYLS